MSSVRSWLQLGALSAIGSRTISFARPKVFLLRTFQKIFLKYPRNQKLAQFIYKVQKSANELKKPILVLCLMSQTQAKKEIKGEMMAEGKKFMEVDELFDQEKFQETLEHLRYFEDKNSLDFQWRFSRVVYEITRHATSRKDKERIKLIREAFACISSALEKDDKNAVIHKLYACLLDAKSEIEGVKERIKQLKNFEKHILLAVELNPEDSMCFYILGTFYYNLADFPWYQRKIMTAIFTAAPVATYDIALKFCLKADSIQPNFFGMNKLLIGKCYNRLNNPDKAKEYWNQAANVAPNSIDNRKCIEEAKKLLSQIK